VETNLDFYTFELETDEQTELMTTSYV